MEPLFDTDTAAVLLPTDPPPFQVINPEGSTPLLLVCDHASNRIPAHLDNLGLDETTLNDHIAWDPGAADVVRIIAARLNCRAVVSNYSRLLIDVNRDPLEETELSIPKVSDGRCIPGNLVLSDTEVNARIDALFTPYHAEIQRQQKSLMRDGRPPALFSVHTFTAAMQRDGLLRPWHAGMLWNQDPRMAHPLMAWLRQHDHLTIGDNQPYSAREFAYTIDRHGHDRGIANCAIEIRQDLLIDQAEAFWWGSMLADGLERVLNNPDLYRYQFYSDAGLSMRE